VNPGSYAAKLTVNGKSYTQPITVKADPRVKTPAPVMQQVYSLTRTMYFGAVDGQTAATRVTALRAQLAERKAQAQGAALDALITFDKTAEALLGAGAGGGRGGRGGGRGAGPAEGAAGRGAAAAGAEVGGGGRGAVAGRGGAGGGAPAPAAETLSTVNAALASLATSLQAADVQPTAIQLAAIASARHAQARVTARFNALTGPDLVALNAVLKRAGLAPIAIR
jgi:hypothetical protein